MREHSELTGKKLTTKKPYTGITVYLFFNLLMWQTADTYFLMLNHFCIPELKAIRSQTFWNLNTAKLDFLIFYLNFKFIMKLFYKFLVLSLSFFFFLFGLDITKLNLGSSLFLLSEIF
jgi:hypothetical protein